MIVSKKSIVKSTSPEHERPGRVRRWTETKRIPCRRRHTTATTTFQDIIIHPMTTPVLKVQFLVELQVAGGAALSRDEGRWIGIPLGIVGGSMIGCQIDGG